MTPFGSFCRRGSGNILSLEKPSVLVNGLAVFQDRNLQVTVGFPAHLHVDLILTFRGLDIEVWANNSWIITFAGVEGLEGLDQVGCAFEAHKDHTLGQELICFLLFLDLHQ